MTFWTDPKVSDEFTPEDRYFYLYLFTNPHTNLSGCYELSFRQMSIETGYSKDTIERLIDRFTKDHKVIDYSKENKEVLLINWHKYNWTSSDKFRKPLGKEIDKIKTDKFKIYLKNLFEGIPYRYGIDTTCIDTTDTDTDTVTVFNINNNNQLYTEQFEKVYKAYPRKGDKKRAYSCYKARLKEEELLKATQNYADFCKKEHREEKYIKLASTFFGVNTPFVDYLKGGDDDDSGTETKQFTDEELEQYKKLL